MMISLKMLRARWTLGWALVKRVLSYVVPFVKRTTPDHWLYRLAGESIAPTPPNTWSHVEGASRCIGCGLCDSIPNNEDQPSEWILGSAREPGDAPLALEQAARLRRLAQEISKICPARVPAEAIASLIEDNSNMLRETEARDAQ